MYTQQEIRSHSNKSCIYAPKGVFVTVLSTFDGVCIVEYKGDRFSCPLSKLGDQPQVDEIVVEDGGLL